MRWNQYHGVSWLIIRRKFKDFQEEHQPHPTSPIYREAQVCVAERPWEDFTFDDCRAHHDCQRFRTTRYSFETDQQEKKNWNDYYSVGGVSDKNTWEQWNIYSNKDIVQFASDKECHSLVCLRKTANATDSKVSVKAVEIPELSCSLRFDKNSQADTDRKMSEETCFTTSQIVRKQTSWTNRRAA